MSDFITMSSRRAISVTVAILIILVIIFAGIAVYFATKPPTVIEKPVEVEKPVEKIVEKPVVVENEIRIGSTQPLTGAFGPAGKNAAVGLVMAQEYINTVKGGVYVKELDKKLPIRVLLYDDRTDPSKAKSLVEKLVIDDKVHALVAPFSSLLTLAEAPVAEQYKVPMVSYAAWSDKIYTQGFKYIFNSYILASKEGIMNMDVLDALNKKLTPPFKTIAIIYSQDAYASVVAEGWKKRAQELGYEVVYYEGVPVELLDYSSIILKLKEVQPDVVCWNTNNVAANIKIVQQMRDLDFNPKMIFTSQISDFADRVIPELGDLANGLVGHAHSPWVALPGIEDAANWFFKEAEARGLGKAVWPGTVGTTMGAFDNILLIADAIERAGSLDSSAIRDALAATDGMFPAGPIKFSENGVNTKRAILLVQFQEGEWKIIYPEELYTVSMNPSPILYPKPAWP
jgi:branched-chain amino acid transport system substrate-binding protein